MKTSVYLLILSVCVGWVFFPALVSAQSGSNSYSTEPLNLEVMPPEILEEATIEFLDELYQNYHQIPAETFGPLREYLYMLINAKVNHIYHETGSIIKEDSALLEMLFFWAEPLGALGGAKVFNEIKSEDSPPFEEFNELPDEISISLENEFLLVESAKGWVVTVPYYFMIWMADDFESALGDQTQAIVVSTGTSPDDSQAGYSQSTISLLYIDNPTDENFAEQWTELFGIGDEAVIRNTDIEGLQSLYSFNEEQQVHTEIADLSKDGYGLLIVYSGYESTWQHNRQHFSDFINHLRISK